MDNLCSGGLYYYYHVFARAFRAQTEPVIADDKGVKHPWREDLCRKLISPQNMDGSWVDTTDCWYEGNPALVTTYAVLALQTALQSTAAAAILPPSVWTMRRRFPTIHKPRHRR